MRFLTGARQREREFACLREVAHLSRLARRCRLRRPRAPTALGHERVLGDLAEHPEAEPPVHGLTLLGRLEDGRRRPEIPAPPASLPR